jgi:hypothetical protein
MKLILTIVAMYGEPYSERSESFSSLYDFGTEKLPPKDTVYERDMRWLHRSRAVIAEISGASTGTGFEIAKAIEWRKPVICLYHESASPSLMITQNPSDCLVVKGYSGEEDLRVYLTSFMEIVSRLKLPGESDEIRRVYDLVLGTGSDKLPEIREIHESTTRIIQKLHEVNEDVNFKDPEKLIPFMIRNMVLQTRWDLLKTQRIGDTFVSGSLPRMITALAESSIDYQLVSVAGQSAQKTIKLAKDYRKYRKQRFGFQHKAFKKNMRAYARIGLVIPQKGWIDSQTDFADSVGIVSSFDGQKRLVSQKSTSTTSAMGPTVAVTKHAQELAAFLRTYGQAVLVQLLKDFRSSQYYKLLAEMPRPKDLSIDLVKNSEMSAFPWWPGLVRYVARISRHALGLSRDLVETQAATISQ